VPSKPVPSDVADTSVRAAVRAAGAELAGAPFVGTVPRGCLFEPLPASAAAVEPFCALSALLVACPPEEDEVKAAKAAPTAAALPAAPRAAAASAAVPRRAHSPDLFSDTDSDGEGQQTQAAEAVEAPASKPAAAVPVVPALAPPLPASAAPPAARKAVTVAAAPTAWAEPHALAALMLRCDPFLSELGALLCA
jgi:hypothetical protein